MKVDEIKKRSFLLSDADKNLKDLKFISLRLSLKAYFSSYKSIKHRINSIEDEISGKDEIDENIYSYDYFDSFASAIINFHHFIELVVKDILKKEHPLLVYDVNKKPEVLFKLLKGEIITSNTLKMSKSIEYGEAILRLNTLIKHSQIDSRYIFFDIYFKELELLNELRNKIIHAGVYILKYDALDEFYGKFVFPILNEIIKLPEYSDFDYFWKYKTLQCKIDPISEIINSYREGKYDIFKVAFLKELGRAGYNNPVRKDVKMLYLFQKKEIENYKRFAQLIVENNFNNYKIKTCPVCGEETFVFEDDSYEERDDFGEITDIKYFWYHLHCTCCGFEAYNNILNPLNDEFLEKIEVIFEERKEYKTI